jgi:hypothetical protein
VQLAFTAYELAVQPFVKLKSFGLAPPSVTEEMCNGAPPGLDTVTFCCALAAPCVMVPNTRFAEESETMGFVGVAVVAEPLTGMICGEFAASSVIVMVAERWPAARGVNVIVIMQPEFAAYGPLQPFVMLNSLELLPPSVTEEIFSVALPEFVTPITIGLLVTP